MNQQINAMQESIKIALDAADAATDVTSDPNAWFLIFLALRTWLWIFDFALIFTWVLLGLLGTIFLYSFLSTQLFAFDLSPPNSLSLWSFFLGRDLVSTPLALTTLLCGCHNTCTLEILYLTLIGCLGSCILYISLAWLLNVLSTSSRPRLVPLSTSR